MSGYTTLKGCNPQQKGDFGGDALVLFLRGEAGVGRIGDELKMLFSLALKVKYLEDTMFSPQDRASGSHTSADLWLPFFLSRSRAHAMGTKVKDTTKEEIKAKQMVKDKLFIMSPYFTSLHVQNGSDDAKSTSSHTSIDSHDDRNKINPLLYKVPRFRKAKPLKGPPATMNVLTLAALVTVMKELSNRDNKAKKGRKYKNPYAESVNEA